MKLVQKEKSAGVHATRSARARLKRSTGVLECWSVGVPTAASSHRSMTPSLHHSVTALLRCSTAAFSLVEMIGILAVIAILAAALAPSLVRQLDKTAADQESAALKALGDALQQSILRKRYIPGP